MEPAHGESCPSGQRRSPGKDKLPYADEKYFHTSTTPTTRARKQRSPGLIPLRTVWKHQPHWPVADWLRVMEPVRAESCPSGQHRGRAANAKDRVLSPNQKFVKISTTLTTGGPKRISPRPMPPRTLWKPQNPTG